MKILELKISGIYRFNGAHFKFYTSRESKNKYTEHLEKYPKSKIYPKDINIIIGGNASGKTTLSKSMLLIERLLHGFALTNDEISTLEENFDFSIKYLINFDESMDYVFEYKACGIGENFTEELLYSEFKQDELITKEYTENKKKYSKYNHMKSIQKKEFIYNKDEGLQSKIMNVETDSVYYDLIMIAKNIGYRFSHVEFGDAYYGEPRNKIPEKLLSNFLKNIDKSIKGIEYTKDDKSDFYIKFHMGEDLLVDHSNLRDSGKRLSYGTVEAIVFLFKVYEILQGGYNTVYIDEELSHIQCELEKVLLLSLIENLPKQTQLFFTTHNTELLKIDLPVSCYTILSETENGNSEVTHVEDYIPNKNDRNAIYNHVKSNYFETEKYYDELFEIFEEMTNVEEK